MRRVAWIGLTLLLFTGAYCAAWWTVSEQSKGMITAWIDALPANVAKISPGEMRRGGFPFAVRWTFSAPQVEALRAMGNVTAHAGGLALWVEIWTPGKLRFRADRVRSSAHHAPSGRAWGLDVGSISGTIETSEHGMFDVRYAAKGLAADEIGSSDTSVAPRRIGEAEAARGTLRGPMRTAATDPSPSRSASLALDGIKIPAVADLLAGERGSARARLTLSGATGDASIEDIVAWRDGSGVLEIDKLDIDWAPIDLTFAGTLALDEQLRLLGAGTANIRGLTILIDRLTERGDIQPFDATLAKLTLALLTRPGEDGGAAVVRLPITAQNGKLRAGPFVLGRLTSIIR